MPRLLHRAPKLRRHKERNLAFVTLNGRKVYLGKWGSAESKREYARVLGEWQAGAHAAPPGGPVGDLSVAELLAAFMRHAQQYYRQSNEAEHFAYSIRELNRLYGRLSVAEFSPLKLQAVRQAMIEAGLARKLINQRVRRIKSIFGWGVSQELVPPSVSHGLHTVRGLSYGRSEAKETDPVKPVPAAFVEAVKAIVAPQLRTMIELQELTGMRPGEVVAMRTCDIDTSGKLWTYTPRRHKTQHHGHERRIYLGPQAQSLLKPWLRLHLEAHLFQPREAVEWQRQQRAANRKTPLSCGNRPGTNRKRAPKRKPSEAYTVRAYHQAIRQACLKASIDPWHPHQLRHNAATKLRKEYGLDVARVVLGHRSPQITEVYAELDHGRAAEVMAKIG
ncbi:MAG: tyrosine-type recombinase/integrase [Pirellulaceae bacterium]